MSLETLSVNQSSGLKMDSVNFDIDEVDGDELHEVFCDWSGWDTSSEDFSWWDLC